MMHVATLNEIDQIVTDRALEPQFRQMFKDNHVECRWPSPLSSPKTLLTSRSFSP